MSNGLVWVNNSPYDGPRIAATPQPSFPSPPQAGTAHQVAVLRGAASFYGSPFITYHTLLSQNFVAGASGLRLEYGDVRRGLRFARQRMPARPTRL